MSAPIVPTAHQFQLAMSKIRLSEGQRIVLSYLGAHSVCHPDEDVQGGGIVQVSAETIAAETGLNKGSVWRILNGFPARGDKGLVGRKVVHRWRRGHSGLEAAWSINGHFNEWDVEWGPVKRSSDPEKAREAVLLELQGADFVARHRAAKPDYFDARTRGEYGIQERVSIRRVRRKRGVSFRASSRGENSDMLSRQRAANIVDFPKRLPSYRDSSNLSDQEKEKKAPPTIKISTGAAAVLAAIADVAGKPMFGAWKDQVVLALCDINDAGWIVEKIRYGKPTRQEALELVLMLANAGPPRPARESAAPCGVCDGTRWILDDESGRERPCPECCEVDRSLAKL